MAGQEGYLSGPKRRNIEAVSAEQIAGDDTDRSG